MSSRLRTSKVHLFPFLLLLAMSITEMAYGGSVIPEDVLWQEFDTIMGHSEGWELAKDKNGIKIYTRKVDISPIKAFKVVMDLETNLSTFVAFLFDADRYPEYVKLCEGAEILKKESETEYYMYSVNRPGWPISPRDTITHAKWSQDPDTLVVTEKCVGAYNFIPEKEGFVRNPLLLVLMKLTPKESGIMEMSLESITEPGGWIPNFVVNLFLLDTPYSMSRKIQEMMPLKEYQGRTISWLVEP